MSHPPANETISMRLEAIESDMSDLKDSMIDIKSTLAKIQSNLEGAFGSSGINSRIAAVERTQAEHDKRLALLEAEAKETRAQAARITALEFRVWTGIGILAALSFAARFILP